MGNDEKLAIINQLISMRSKVSRSSLTLKFKGEDTTSLEQAEQRLEDRIRQLRSALHQEWQGSVNEVKRELRNANRRIQSRIRDINRDVKRAEKAVEILGQVDELMSRIAPLIV